MTEISEQAVADVLGLTPVEPAPSPGQLRAIELCCDTTQTIASVTGGAGTGKTFVLGRAYRELKQMRMSIVLCAPTGRAAKRIQELTGIPAKTVHRLLEYPMPDEFLSDEDIPNEPRRNRQRPFDQRVVIVDESSMLSDELMQQLFNALPRNGLIRFFGDNNQLPPVEETSQRDGANSAFARTLRDFPMVELTINYRSGDYILENAARILKGRMPMRNPGFEIYYDGNPVQRLIKEAAKRPEFADASHQIIMPTRRGKFGTMRVNPSLQLAYNPSGPLLLLDRYDAKEAKLAVRSGDKFLWIHNDYQLNMFNGEIGRIDWVDPEDGELGLITPERRINVPARCRQFSTYHGHVIDYDPRKQIELGYAVTTHKAQGSEFDTVIYCIAKGQWYLLNRRNFYTAVTRAKKRVIVIAEPAAMGGALRKYEA